MQTDRKDCDCPEFGFKSESPEIPLLPPAQRSGLAGFSTFRSVGEEMPGRSPRWEYCQMAQCIFSGSVSSGGSGKEEIRGGNVENNQYNTMVTVEIRIDYGTIPFAEQTGRHQPQTLNDEGRGVAVGIPPVLHVYGRRKCERAPAQGADKVQGLEFAVRVITEKMIRSGRNSRLHGPSVIPYEARILEICTLRGFYVDKGDIGLFCRQPVEVVSPVVMGNVDTAHRIFLPVGIGPFSKPAVVSHHSQFDNQESQDNSNRYFKPYSQRSLSFEG